MKWCVSFPEEEMLVVRPCLTAICFGNKAAAKLLSTLLYRYSIRKESKEDAENINELRAAKGSEPTQDTSFRIYRKQEQLVKDMCGEITEKTLHDVAVPVLQLLGYLDIDESSYVHCYDLHLNVVVEALELYKKGGNLLAEFIRANFQQQLEKFLIDIELEKFLINKKYFSFQLEKVLIVNRNNSNCQRGRKPAPEKAASTQKPKPQITRENIEISSKEEDRQNNTTSTIVPPPPPQKTKGQKSSSRVRETPQPEKKIALSPGAQEVYDEWCKMPWFKAKPDLTPTLAVHCETAKAYMPTADIMLKVKNDATSTKNDRKGFYKGKGWNFKFFLNELPQWLAMHPDISDQGKTQQVKAGQMTHDEARQLAADIVEQAKEHRMAIQANATSTSNGAWIVSAFCDGEKLNAITSRPAWEKYFVQLQLIAEDLATEQKGAR